MHVDVWDSAFVRARRADVHPILVDFAGYGQWWPGLVSTACAGGARMLLRPPRVAARPQRLQLLRRRVRRDLGVDFEIHGRLEGAGEWYYLDEPAGVVLHYVLHVEVGGRGWRRTVADHRASVRAALHSLKDRLERGRLPGAEPDPTLLADQRRAIAEFRAAVDAASPRGHLAASAGSAAGRH